MTMNSLITWQFIKEFQPLPPRDRRLVLRELKVSEFDHRDEATFYEWLAERYRSGEAGIVDRALERVCSKGEERTSLRCLMRFMMCRTGRKPASAEATEALSRLVQAACELTDDTPRILRALSSNFRLLQDHEDLLDGSSGESAEVASVSRDDFQVDMHLDECVEADRSAEKVLTRLHAALDRLSPAPDPDLIAQADGLAAAIEAYLERIEDEMRSTQLRDEIWKALNDLLESWSPPAPLKIPVEASSERWLEIRAAITQLASAASADRDARVRLASAVSGPRTERFAAQQALDVAEEALEAAEAALVGLLSSRDELNEPDAGDLTDHDFGAHHEGDLVEGDVSPTDISSETTPAPSDALNAPDGRPDAAEENCEGSEPVPDGARTDELRRGAEENAAVAHTAAAPESRSSVAHRGLTELDGSEPMKEVEIAAVTPVPPLGGEAESPHLGLVDMELADALADPTDAGASWDKWIEAALAARRLGLAVHLAAARDLAGAKKVGSIDAAVIEGILYGASAQTAYDGSWTAYDLLGDRLFGRSSEGLATCARDLLLYAGALRPALLQSHTGQSVLDGLEGAVAAKLNSLTRAIESLRNAGISSIAEIAAPAGENERRARADQLLAELAEWNRTAAMRTTSFQRATLIWQDLVAGHGAIGCVARSVVARAPNARSQVKTLVARLRDERDEMIDEAHARLSRRARLDPIVGNARKQLHNHMTSILGLFTDWLTTQEVDPASVEDRHKPRRQELVRELAGAQQSLGDIKAPGGDRSVAVSVLRQVIKDLQTELEGHDVTLPIPIVALDDELALLPAFPLNARRAFHIEPDDVLPLAAAAKCGLAKGVPDVREAFEQALELGAASSAKRLIAGLPLKEREAAERALVRMENRERERLLGRVRRLRQRLDDLQIALSEADPLPERLERDMTALEQMELEGLPRDSGEAGDVADFPAAHGRLDRIETRLDAARRPVLKRLEKRIEEQERKLSRSLEECRTLLRDGDLGTVSEEIGQVERFGLAGPPGGSPVETLERFSALLEAVGEVAALPLPDLARAAGVGGRVGLFDFSSLPEPERARAASLIQAWTQLRRAVDGRLNRAEALSRLREAVVIVLAQLQFTGVRSEPAVREKAWFRVNVTTDPLRARESCLIPAFGSEADGRYAVLVVPSNDVGSCLTLFDSLPEHVLLFMTDPLTPRQRREFQRKARGGTRSVAVFDALTMVMLAATPGAGTRQLFDLSVPFGSAQPYADAGSQTSIEMFFGRDKELRRLVERQGACFVYGGRQLGKTALLKQIELRENSSADRVALYCDIRAVGASIPADQVWHPIREALNARGVTLPNGGSLPASLRGWVEDKPGRYLLILLDEADAFLESEMATDFPVIGAMKALMEQTQRGVKFVFAGLHNVQRFHRAPNSPLLHLGSSINVGPLLGSDREAARQMVFEPMAALGMKFDRPTDAYHMLSLVGFYPSLMQSFGKAVVEAVADELKKPGDAPLPPIGIRRALIDDCFAQQAFRTSVVERFQKTLQLDERYELITYAVWQRTQQDNVAGRSSARGYPASVIRQLANEWWPVGFRDTESPDSFAAILDEMTEMGVLAREGESYALRSHRIAAMLGTDEEIEDRLLSFAERAPRRRPDPMSSHRRMGKVWSPLSIRQEAILVAKSRAADGARLVLLGAVPASGGELLPEAVMTLAMSLGWPKPRKQNFRTVTELIKVAQDEQRHARPGIPQIVLVTDRWPGPEEVEQLRRSRVLRETQRPVRFFFCGAPDAATESARSEPDVLRLSIGPLPMEAMFHWMNRKQLAYAEVEGVQGQLRTATGGYLAALDAITVSQSLRDDPAHLVAAATRIAGELDPRDLGLMDELEGLARALRKEIGDEPLDDNDLLEWVRTIGGGEQDVARLKALGVLEAVVRHSSDASFAFNPLASRLLA
jgi:hypothetical protein